MALVLKFNFRTIFTERDRACGSFLLPEQNMFKFTSIDSVSLFLNFNSYYIMRHSFKICLLICTGISIIKLLELISSIVIDKTTICRHDV